MNAKKLVMLLAVVAIAVGVYFMMNKGGDECMCCNEYVMDADGNATSEKNADYSADCGCCDDVDGDDDDEEEEMEEEEMEEEEEEEEMEEPK